LLGADGVDNSAKIRILVVEDDRPMAELMRRILESEGYEVALAGNLEKAKLALREAPFPVIVSDIGLGASNGLSLIPFVQELHPNSLMVFITGQACVDSAVTAIRDGAFEYLPKPLDLEELETSLKGAVDRAVRQLKLRTEPESVHTIRQVPSTSEFIGKSPLMAAVYRSIAKAALFRGNVLIQGESGTGKELVAQAIHRYSVWASRPFVTVNCAALTDTLLESELFGHVKGAFTGAIQNKRGLFEEADGGTIFLDEIGDISLSVQVKMLRAIQEGEIKPVGSTESRKVDVRVVAATHRDLELYIKEGKFREDLYFRLKVMMIQIPPLRDRVEDLPDLVDQFVTLSCRASGKEITAIAQSALEALKAYPWPGNVRELEHAVQRAVAVSNSSILFPEDFPEEIVHLRDLPPIAGGGHVPEEVEAQEPNATTLKEMERRHITRTLREVGFNKSRAAQLLGIDRVTLYRKAAQYGIPLSYAPKPGPEA
jgi:two-component system, NtrC family, response regulator AtoC